MATLTPEQSAWVESNTPRVKTIARSVKRLLPEANFDDLESAGYEGLVQAALRYDPESGVSFATFSHYRVRGSMIDWVRAQNPGLRRHSRALRALAASQDLLEEQAGRSAGDRRALEERVAAARALVERTAASVLTARAMDNEPDELGGEENPEKSVIQRELHQRLGGEVDKLPPEDRELIDAIYVRGETMHELAQRLEVATSTVSRRHTKLMSRLARQLRS